ncbi:hypothetical protein [Pedobacter mucosus]|uniref:hypothetical protein n=1 Tax=Pedobacter mucosus TaxID=2895286 RepID=UPI001EE3D15C|nr:hypothetical protein [Pedobacter mucosus]UKT63772.1 hypothetical protein LOK61_18630 [Pedobacter mucosus]
MKVEFKKVRDFGQVINDTFTFIRQNLKPLLKTYLIFCGLFVLAGMLTMLLQQYKTLNVVNDITRNHRNFSIFGSEKVFGFEYFLTILFSLASYASMSVAILSYITLYVQKGNQIPTNEEILGYFKYYFFRVFGSSILLILMLIVSVFFCVVPFFYLFPFVAMMFPIMVFENGSLGYSFGRSFKIIKDNFWITFGTLFIMWIIVYACMTFIVLPSTIFSMIGVFTHNTPHISVAATLITTVLQSLCQVFTIIPIVTITLSYFSLVEQKESAGLMERIAHFGNTEKPIDTRPEEY